MDPSSSPTVGVRRRPVGPPTASGRSTTPVTRERCRREVSPRALTGGAVGSVVRRLLGIALCLGAVLSAGSGSASAEEFFVEMFDGAFLPSNLTVTAGDTVTWVWIAGDHIVSSGVPNGTPGTPDEPGALFEAPVNAANPSFSHVFPGPAGTVSFFDTLNPGQVGFVQVLGDALTFDVAVLDNVYEPEFLEIFAGDSVRWVHEPMEMFHTITSGLSSDPVDDPGALFDEPSSDANPIFVYLFPDPGEVPYFCIPHEALGMTGLVRVQARFVRGDANGDGLLGIADAISSLGVLFQGQPGSGCADASDANDDGAHDLGDVIWTLAHLFTGGAPPPAPYPSAGPDRTADPLLCLD